MELPLSLSYLSRKIIRIHQPFWQAYADETSRFIASRQKTDSPPGW